MRLWLVASWIFALSALAPASGVRADAPAAAPPRPANRVASIYIAEDFINEQLEAHMKSELLQDFRVRLDPDLGQIFLTGAVQVPVEELRAINLDPKLGKFRFQMAAKLATTRHGHLVIEFPLNKTFFYPYGSKNPAEDRVIVPVQMLSIALASARGYLAALSGDFGGFDRRTKKLQALIKALDRAIPSEKNPDARDDLVTQRDSLRLQLEAVPIERKQLQSMSKELSGFLGFTGEKEIGLNDELAARKNALLLKIRLSQFTPYLEGVDLGGVRIRHDKKDGAGQNYLVIDVNAKLNVPSGPAESVAHSDRPPMKVPPVMMIRLRQALLESDAVVSAEKQEMGTKLKEFQLSLQDDGLHVSGKAHALLFFSVPFNTTVDFVSTGPDVFEARVREIKVAGIGFDFLGKFILESIKRRLNHSLKGICHFRYVGEGSDQSRALRVTVSPKELVPAFPDLHLVDVDVRSREFILKVGRI